MVRKALLVIIIILVLAVLSSFLYSAIYGVPKDIWARTFKAKAPSTFCYGLINSDQTGKILAEHNITYDKCLALIPNSINRCVQKYLPSLPARLNNSSSRTWGTTIGQCVGSDFYDTNIGNNTPAAQ